MTLGMMAHTIVNLSPDVGLYVFALVMGMYAAAVRIRDGATGLFVALFGLAIVTTVLGEILSSR